LIERLTGTNSFAESVAALEKVLARFGLENFAFLDLPDSRQRYSDFMFCRRVPAGWLEAYTAANYNQISPALRLVRRASRPFIWADAPYDAEREPRIVEYLQHMADFGLDKGLMIPAPRVTGRTGIVWFSGPAPKFDAPTISALQLIALFAFEHIRRFQAPPYEQRRSSLTEREREVLTWVAVGKTAWEIGGFTSLSERLTSTSIQSATSSTPERGRMLSRSRSRSLIEI
jgi:LuxR family quorum sensing-dependent transcriptional regulator